MRKPFLFIIMGMVLVTILLIGIVMVMADKKANTQKLTQELQLVKKDSHFYSFWVEEEKVYMRCDLTIKNISSMDKIFTLEAISPKEVFTGLLE